MTKQELSAAVQAVKAETKDALQTLYNELNQGQQKKLLKSEVVKTMFERYGWSIVNKEQTMVDTAHYQTDLKLEEMEKRLSAIYSTFVDGYYVIMWLST